MKPSRRAARAIGGALGTACLVFSVVAALAAVSSPLPSWRDGPARRAILAFVAEVTDPASPKFVPPAERVAVFDNDGTLWAEQPMYVQLAFALDRVRALAAEHPEWKEREPYRSVLAGDLAAVLAGGHGAVLDLVIATHAGMTTEQFAGVVRDWLASAKDPRFGRAYTELVYQPMLELLVHLRQNGFATYIVSAGGVDFMRPWSERVYGIPPEQVIGSSILLRYDVREGVPVLMREGKVDFVDDGPAKPVAIHRAIGRRPVMAFGNSDGDLEMLAWTTARPGPSFAALVHHTDGEREWAYDRGSRVGRLDNGLTAAEAKGWTIVDMKTDWARVFPFE